VITANSADAIAKQLEEYSAEVERKLKNMVAGFAREVALAASENTPVGTAEDIIREGAYQDYYLDRQKAPPAGYGIEAKEGYHSGAWQYSEGDLKFSPMIFTAEQMADDVENEAAATYKLGDSFAIGAIGPGYEFLEGGNSAKARQGVTAPTLAQIQASPEADLKRYYDAG
jgi:hypothetical protein